jgi:protein O-GlcNAc transferase
MPPKPYAAAITVVPADKINAVLKVYQSGQFALAKSQAERLTKQYPMAYDSHLLLGQVLRSLKKPEEAAAVLERAARLAPKHPTPALELALALTDAEDDRAEAALQKAIELDPMALAAYQKLIDMMTREVRSADALDLCRQARRFITNEPNLFVHEAVSLINMGLLKEAAELVGKAQMTFPMAIPIAELAAFIGNYVYTADRERVFNLARNYGRLVDQHAPFVPLKAFTTPRPEKKLRVGFVSADLREHSVAYFLMPLLKAMDKTQFELVGISPNPHEDDVTHEFKRVFDEWVVLPEGPVEQGAAIVRTKNIDVTIDLHGLTRGHVLTMFHAGAAPVQMTYLGYPNTTGLSALQYRLVDHHTDPLVVEGMEEQGDVNQRWCVEKLVRMDGSFLCYLPTLLGEKLPAARTPRKAGSGPIRFGTQNATMKFSPAVLELWRQVLEAVPGAIFVCKSQAIRDDRSKQGVMEVFKRSGFDMSRVEFAGRVVGRDAHLQSYELIDIALDTYPYHGTTTTCESLLMGVPTLSLIGQVHASRVGKSILTTAGVPELAAHSPQEFVQKAAELAKDEARIAMYHASLREKLLSSPLCDAASHARKIERVIRELWQAWCSKQQMM